MASLQDLLLTNNGAFGTGSPAEESQKPSFLGNLLLGLTKSAATLPQRAIQNSQFALNTGNYDPSVPMEAALGLTGGAGIVPAEANSLRMGIKAYHGSPHDFDAFSMDKIGTGEGAQAYGHGLYFADNEGVAKSYRDQLKSQAFNFDGKTVPRDQAVDALAERVRQVMPDAKQPSSAAKMVADWTQGGLTPDQIEARIKAGAWPESTKGEIRAAAQVVQDSIKPNTGHMYEVNINADPAHFLDWDKKVRDMPEEMQQRLMGKGLAASHGGDLGSQIYHRRVDEFGNEAATQQLREAGIPGVKYLDGGSRGAGQGSSNYVVFKDDIINIVRKYAAAGIAVPPAIMAQYQKINEQQ